jgi:P4 family phage/plasmid primase-like protien
MHRLYWDEIVQPGRTDSLTEKQRDNGPLLLDLDFRFPAGSSRLYTQKHVETIVESLTGVIAEMCEDGSDPRIFVLEKPEPFQDKDVVKDGLHFVVDLASTTAMQKYVRERLLALLPEKLADLPLLNQWTEVLDDTIARGSTNWQLYGSSKPGKQPYRGTYVFQGGQATPATESFDSFVALSAREVARPAADPSLVYNQWLMQQDSTKEAKTSPRQVSPLAYAAALQQGGAKRQLLVPMESILGSTGPEEWAAVMQEWKAAASPDWRLVHEMTMALPPAYYELGKGTRERWLSTCWALRNTGYGLLPVWIDFSCRASGFDWSSIGSLIDHWEQGYGQGNAGLTKRSILYWCKQDNPAAYQDISQRDVDQFIEQCAMNPTHEDLARILHKMYRHDFVCTRGGLWYENQGHRWVQSDNGYGLRKRLSELRNIYRDKKSKIIDLLRTAKPVSDPAGEPLQGGSVASQAVVLDMSANPMPMQDYRPEQLLILNKKYQEMCSKLGDTNMKSNIMKEACQLFYDGEFIGKLDERTGLLCFNNGVADFEQGVFRAGLPDDFISMTTHIDFLPMSADRVAGGLEVDMVFDPAVHQPIVDDIHDFMAKIYPDPALREYMWQHLASALTGSENQNFNIYIGKGSNGKSVLTKLMADVLGDYKRDVPLTLITEKRQKVGGLAPEIAELKGVRYAVMQESSKGDAVNEGVLKQLTSGTDTIQGRGLYNPAPTRFVPQFKLVMCTNELLDIKSMDGGTWRRMRVVPHVSRFTDNPDPNPAKFEFQKLSETEIKRRMTPLWKRLFVSLLVEKAFQTKGVVQDCSIVMEASDAYKARQDIIGTFAAEELIEDNTAYLKKDKLSTHFKSWWERTQTGKCNQKNELTAFLDAKYGKCEPRRGWKGVRINYADDDEEED